MGVGGFGEVWKAKNPHLPLAAFKFCTDTGTAKALRNEAALLGRVARSGRHPGIVALEDTSLSHDPPYLRYEFVPGGDLTGLLIEWGRADPSKRVEPSVRMMHQLATIIGFAHRQGLVHRDLKPANILLQPIVRGSFSLRIADFGIGGLTAAQALKQTKLGTTPGEFLTTGLRGSCTPMYASLQQRRGAAPSSHDDIYSLGVIWYQMLRADPLAEITQDWRDELKTCQAPENVLALLTRCLSTNLDIRPADGTAMAEEMARLMATAPSPSPNLSRAHSPRQVLPGGAPPPSPIKTIVPSPSKEDDLVGQLDHAHNFIARTEAAARQLADTEHDYFKAAASLETVPTQWQHLRNPKLLRSLIIKRDRTVQLDREIKDAVAHARLTGLRGKVVELLGLWPQCSDLRRLLDSGKLLREAGEISTVTLPGDVIMRFAWCPAGSLYIHETQRRVTLTKGFWLGVTTVSQAQWQAVMCNNPSNIKDSEDPVDQVSWDDCQVFSQKLGKLVGKTFRLPTEAEWEHAAHAGRKNNDNLVEEAGRLEKYVSFNRCHIQIRDPGQEETPNDWGLYGMDHNIWEWCQDYYASYESGDLRDPQGSKSGEARVIRGSGLVYYQETDTWDLYGGHSANRGGLDPVIRHRGVGCRVIVCLD